MTHCVFTKKGDGYEAVMTGASLYTHKDGQTEKPMRVIKTYEEHGFLPLRAPMVAWYEFKGDTYPYPQIKQICGVLVYFEEDCNK